ncbi:hypothetical protein SEPCBS119000_000059 [Sporothrix epigloea]|uniref:Uncharacterized protein n=1 Tax=Sporothrix epigloea TaxID=1892477 RepID=A0ABP0D348_9PEZI
MAGELPDLGVHASHVQAGSEPSQAQASSSQQEPLLKRVDNAASKQPVIAGVDDSDQKPSSDRVLPEPWPQAYVLEWAPNMRCTRTPLDVDADDAPTSADHSRNHAIRRVLELQAKAGPSSPIQRLFVLRDDGSEAANAEICSALDIDPAFLAAHTAGRRYRPRVRPWRLDAGKNTTYSSVCYTYPQTLTVTVSDPFPSTSSRETDEKERRAGTRTETGPDVPIAGTDCGKRPARSRTVSEKAPAPDASSAASDYFDRENYTSRKGSFSSNIEVMDSSVAMFCRASLWTSPRADVLLLDRDLSPTSLEEAFFDALNDISVDSTLSTVPEFRARFLADTLSGLAYDQWLDFTDTLSFDRRDSRQSKLNKKLLLDMAQRLEQNLEASRAYEKQAIDNHRAAIVTNPDDWRALLSRLQRIVTLLPLQAQQTSVAATDMDTAKFRVADTSYNIHRVPPGGIRRLVAQPASETAVDLKNGGIRRSLARISNARHQTSISAKSAEHNALKRITYMGGILLPFSIIAGVLSMSDPFGPGDRMFWVYWVITLPITALTLVIIYADEIRRSYIWKPLSHKSLEEAYGKGEALKHAAEVLMDKVRGVESDTDIEADTVLSAVRLVDSPTSAGGWARLRVDADRASRGPTLYRLSGPSRQNMAAAEPVRQEHSRLFDRMSRLGDNVQLPSPVSKASVRRRLHILGPLRRVWSTRTRPGYAEDFTKPEAEPIPFSGDIEPAISSGEAFVINVSKPNVDPRIAGMFGPPDGMDVTDPDCPIILLPPQEEGADPAAWRRQQLGWVGAVKKMAGFLKIEDA